MCTKSRPPRAPAQAEPQHDHQPGQEGGRVIGHDRRHHLPIRRSYSVRHRSRACSYAVEQGKLATNPTEGIKALYSSDRAAIIWTDADIARIKAVGSLELGHTIDVGALTGLRRGDLLRLSWSHVHDNEICHSD